jgi:peptide deformylase
MTRPIILAGDTVLRAPAAPVPSSMLGTPELQTLIEEMVATMRAAPGVGLAAPQIGVGLQLIVLEEDDESMAHLTDAERKERGRIRVPLTAIINPVLRRAGDADETFVEGCLSVPGYSALVARARAVEVEGLAPDGTPLSLHATGWPARILQHECDHLAGTLYVDRMITRSFTAHLQQTRAAAVTPAGGA